MGDRRVDRLVIRAKMVAEMMLSVSSRFPVACSPVETSEFRLGCDALSPRPGPGMRTSVVDNGTVWKTTCPFPGREEIVGVG